MPSTQFEATVRQRPTLAVIDLRGEINRDAETALSEAYEAAITTSPSTVLLNFGQIDYINSTGIAVIVGLLARARKDERTLVVCGLSDHYRQIFEITRLIDFMQVFPDETAALDAMPTATV